MQQSWRQSSMQRSKLQCRETMEAEWFVCFCHYVVRLFVRLDDLFLLLLFHTKDRVFEQKAGLSRRSSHVVNCSSRLSKFAVNWNHTWHSFITAAAHVGLLCRHKMIIMNSHIVNANQNMRSRWNMHHVSATLALCHRFIRETGSDESMLSVFSWPSCRFKRKKFFPNGIWKPNSIQKWLYHQFKQAFLQVFVAMMIDSERAFESCQIIRADREMFSLFGVQVQRFTQSCTRSKTPLDTIFFPLLRPIFALRLGPNIERSG